MANGKGDKNRVSNREAYRSNYDDIFAAERLPSRDPKKTEALDKATSDWRSLRGLTNGEWQKRGDSWVLRGTCCSRPESTCSVQTEGACAAKRGAIAAVARWIAKCWRVLCWPWSKR